MTLTQHGASHRVDTPKRVVLVVEHEALLALDLEQVLIGAGHEVVLAASGLGALASAADPALLVQAAIVNLNLPAPVTGRDVIRRLRLLIPGLPVIVATGYAPLAPEADLRGLGGPTARLDIPLEPER